MEMKNTNETRMVKVEPSAEPDIKKPYQTPELTVHGRVDQITQFLLSLTSAAERLNRRHPHHPL
jgi:hypothetical protein